MTNGLSWDREGADWPLREFSRFVTVGHLRWHVQRLGPPASDRASEPSHRTHPPRRLWLLHGTGASTHTWRDVAPILAQHHEVISVDLPGHAFTRGATDEDLTLPGMAAALIALHATLCTQENGSRSASNAVASKVGDAWIGHSAGAAIALSVMKQQPSIAHQVVSLNGALLPWGGRAGALFMPVARALATHPWSLRFFTWSARRPGTVEALLQDTGSVIDERGRRLYERLAHDESHLHAVMRMMGQWELEPFAASLPSINGRCTLISSERDSTVPPSVSRRAARLIPGSRLIELPRWGHLGHEEAPAEWSSLILQALG
jgi:magnesium chelatase accessory protein